MTAADRLVVGVVQMALEAGLAENLAKIIQFIDQAREQGCHVVVFPEGALTSPPDTLKTDIEAAVAAIQRAARAERIHVILGLLYKRSDEERLFNSLLVIDADGEVLLRYHKLFSIRPNHLPGPFHILGIPCHAIICADRWIRGVEDLPAIHGSRIAFECSDNYRYEWLPEMGHYWCVPRAMRNGTYAVFANTATNPRAQGKGPQYERHGHSAVISPSGDLVAQADGDEPDRLLVVPLDVGPAMGAEARRRRAHPLLAPWWESGLRTMDGEHIGNGDVEALASPAATITVAAAQMAVSGDIQANVARMVEMIRDPRASGADLIAFPELAVTGTIGQEIARADVRSLDAAIQALRRAARSAGIAVAFGTPRPADGGWLNCACVIGPQGELLTQHAQVVVDRPELFRQGTDLRSIWFRIRGIPAVVTIGYREALWSEIAELAAVRGAQVHVHLENDPDPSEASALRRKQVWANLASFRTLTVTVTAAGSGGSIIWEDFRRGRRPGQPPFSAVPVAEAGRGEEIIMATRAVNESNPFCESRIVRLTPQLAGWYAMGARIIGGA